MRCPEPHLYWACFILSDLEEGDQWDAVPNLSSPATSHCLGLACHRLARQTATWAAAGREAWLESIMCRVECGTGTSQAEQEAFAPPLLPERKMKVNWTTDAFSTVLMGTSGLLKRDFFPITLSFLSLMYPLLFTFQMKSLFFSNILIKKKRFKT